MRLKVEKDKLLQKYDNEEDRLLISRLLDKIEESKKRNRVTTTNFLDERQQEMIQNVINSQENCYLEGFAKEAERKLVVIYPKQMEESRRIREAESKITIFRILLPKDLIGSYSHRQYLGALMKLGIKREKIGDILVDENGADIIACKEIEKYIEENITSLTRFQKAVIEKIRINEIREIKQKKENFTITVTSLRLDNVVAELAGCSREKGQEIIKQERVFVNHQLEIKNTKQIKIGDKVSIRGKGRFYIKEIVGTTKKGRNLVLIETFTR